jgi:hypothetical protein
MLIGGVIKSLLMLIATLVLLGYAIYLAYNGEWIAAAIVAFIVEPIALFVLDLATGAVVALFAGAGAAVGAAVPRRPDEEEYDYRPDYEV